MNYYKDLSMKLFDMGYKPIPIRPKSKIPFMNKGESWQVEIDKAQVEDWASNGKGKGGVAVTGIGGLDFDIKDKKVSNAIINYLKKDSDIKGKILIRVGLAPKFLVPVSTNSDIPKKWKNTWFDQAGEKHEIEFLSPSDQYFLTHGIHPDTGKEYKWFKDFSIENIPAADLPVVDEMDLTAIEDKFDELAAGLGWTRKGKEKTKDIVKTSDDPFENYKPSGNADIEELKTYLEKLPVKYCDDREDWIRIGAAIHHGTGGSDEGYQLFDTWSQTSSLYKGKDDTKGRWKSFSIDKQGGNASTVGSIVHILQEEGLLDEVKVEAAVSYEDKIKTASNQKVIRKIMKQVKGDKTIDNLTRSDIAMWVRDKVKRDLKGNWKLTDITPMITPKKVVVEIDEEDKWLKDWFFLSNQNKFAKVGNGDMVKRASFNAMYSRNLIDRSELETKHKEADKYALDIKQMPFVYDLLYLPGAGEQFVFEDKKMINAYDPTSEGKRKPQADWSGEDRAAVEFFLEHIQEMFPLMGEARLLLDSMGYVVQHPGQRLLWALVIYGCEGDGKTTICKVLSRAVGSVNAGIVNGADIVNSSFSDWAVGQRFKVAEELKVSGKNRFETVDRIKTFITNDPVSINPKYQVPKKVPNTATIFATTNHKDAIPFLETGRRFALICSKWESKKQITDKHGKDYFNRLIDTLEEHEEALNEYLYIHKVEKSFDPFTLPVTPSLITGIDNERQDLMVVISDIIESGKYKQINNNVVVMKSLREIIATQIDFGEIDLDENPKLGEVKRTLQRLGYGRSKQVTILGSGIRVWIKNIANERSEIVAKIEGKNINEEYPGEDIF
jgi:hypothetical protein